MAVPGFIPTPVKRVFGLLASLKIAIPLLVIATVVTIAGSLLPQPDVFKTWWYLGLLGLLGLSLLFVTILHIPAIRRKKGRKALIGVVTTHAGILILIAGAIYGGLDGFRYKFKAIEGEMTVVPGLPWVLRLDRLVIEEYPAETFAHLDLELLPRKRQESHVTLFSSGQPVFTGVASPGRPAIIGDVKVLPSISDIGWYFELVVTDSNGREKYIPVRPWAPPLIQIGDASLMAHSLVDLGGHKAQLLAIEDEKPRPLGFVSAGQTVEFEGYTIALGPFKRYTSLKVYSRPQMPVLFLGCVLLLAGLVWHFYYRHQDQSQGRKENERDA